MAEYSGTGLGFILGVLTFTGSALRRARIFHPRGHLYQGEIHSLHPDFQLPQHALIRLSQGIWKSQRWPDVLGFSMRLSFHPMHSEKASGNEQDLLFATFPHVWQLPVSPFLSAFHFGQNNFFGIAPFQHKGKVFKLRLQPEWKNDEGEDRFLEVDRAVSEGKASAVVQLLEAGDVHWRDLARVFLKKHSHLDQEALRFNPFLNGAGITPVGFIHHLRIGAYKMSQLARPRSLLKYQGRESVLPSSQPSHSPSALT